MFDDTTRSLLRSAHANLTGNTSDQQAASVTQTLRN